MISRGAGGHDILDKSGDRAAAVVINHKELVVLHGIDDPFHIGSRKFVHQRGRKQSRKRFCNNDAARSGGFIRFDIIDQKGGGLLQNHVDHIRLLIAEDHDLRHVKQSARQRIRSDDAGENRSVRDERTCFLDRLHIQSRTGGSDRRYGERLRVLFRFDDSADHSGNLVVADLDLRAERLRFDGKIHHADRSGAVDTVCDPFHALGLQITARNQLLYRDSHQLNRRKGEHRHRRLDRSRSQCLHPLFHIHSEKSSEYR